MTNEVARACGEPFQEGVDRLAHSALPRTNPKEVRQIDYQRKGGGTP